MKKLCKVLIYSLLITIFSIQFVNGRSDIVGYTTSDWQFSGPVYTRCRVDLVADGIHICWATENGAMYNFYDFVTRTWNWQNGTNISTTTCNLGGMDYDPISGNVVILINVMIGGIITPCILRDQEPGAGFFQYSYGPAGYRGGPIGVNNNQAICCLLVRNDSLWYLTNWSTPVLITPENFGGYNIASSKISNKVVALWMCPEDSIQERAFYRLSDNSGNTWQPTVQLPFPPSQGFVPTYHITSLFVMFDNQDNLHIVASVAETSRTLPCEIWHFCPINNPQWTLINHFDAQTITAQCGYNALFTTRPSIVQNPSNNYFYAVWEQFDTLNYEPLTCLARADIWLAELTNNGQTVSRKGRITDPNTKSKRFPIVGGVFNDTIIVNYLIDSIAGFSNLGQGPITNNPVVCQFRGRYDAIEEMDIAKNTYNIIFETNPNPFTTHTAIHLRRDEVRFSLPAQNNTLLEIYDVTGRLIKTLNAVSGSRSAINEVVWDGRDNQGAQVKNGIYFCSLKTNDKTVTKKIAKSR